MPITVHLTGHVAVSTQYAARRLAWHLANLLHTRRTTLLHSNKAHAGKPRNSRLHWIMEILPW